MARSKKKKWMKFRHKVVRVLAGALLKPFCAWRYGIQIEKFKEQQNTPYLILYNHQTPFDQFFVGLCFKGPVYYLATEDIFSKGWISSLIRWLVAPIPIKKQTTDLTAVKTCLRVAKEGGTLAIAPEGNRTYSGRTLQMNPAIGGLAKKLGLPIALVRIEGGYGVQPRWSDRIRKGKMKSYVSRVITPEEYKDMTADQLFTLIEEGLWVDENKADGIFPSKHRAEHLERAVYFCPFCGLSTFQSKGNRLSCRRCSLTVEYGEDKTITGVGYRFPYTYFGEWYDAQEAYMNGLDLNKYTEKPCYVEAVEVWEVHVNKKKERVIELARLDLYGNRLVLGGMVIPFEDISTVTVLGRNKLNLYCNGTVYQLRGDKGFNALKYVHFVHRYKNIQKGEGETFLGI